MEKCAQLITKKFAHRSAASQRTGLLALSMMIAVNGDVLVLVGTSDVVNDFKLVGGNDSMAGGNVVNDYGWPKFQVAEEGQHDHSRERVEHVDNQLLAVEAEVMRGCVRYMEFARAAEYCFEIVAGNGHQRLVVVYTYVALFDS